MAVVAAGPAVTRTALGLATSRWVTWTVTTTPWRRRVLVVVGLALLVALEVRQQSRADLLMGV